MTHDSYLMNHCILFFIRIVSSIDLFRHGKANNKKGFTLVELLMVVVIIGILAAVTIPAFTNYRNNAKISRAMSEIRTLSTAISAYYFENNSYPTILDDIPNLGNSLDPWQTPYVYNNIKLNGGPLMDPLDVEQLNIEFDLYSRGSNLLSAPSGADPDNMDDIVLSNDGAFVGLR